ncbi:patatin-like phospholipase family protein, partial [Acinetobacter baumannii]
RSGSSAGAIMAGMLGTSSPSAFQRILAGETFFSEAVRFRDTKDLLRGNGGLADVKYLKTFLIEILGDLTFSEALEKSGLHINVAVAPY